MKKKDLNFMVKFFFYYNIYDILNTLFSTGSLYINVALEVGSKKYENIKEPDVFLRLAIERAGKIVTMRKGDI